MSRPFTPRPEERSSTPLGALLPEGGLPTELVATGVTLDSRMVQSGDLYVALRGQHVHGASFTRQAIERGAVAVLTDAAGASQLTTCPIPVVVVDDPRERMADVAAGIYDHPTRKLLMLGVTGTNGKTTTAFLLGAMLERAGLVGGIIGTVGFLLEGRPLVSERTTVTTPESPELQGLLAAMAERGADSVTMEVSSHALSLHRVDAIGFDVAGFTNLGNDHLDFHRDLDDYFEAKARLFTSGHCRHAVINTDDPRGRQLADRVRALPGVRLSSTGLDRSADFTARDITTLPDGRTRFLLVTPEGEYETVLGLPGEFNVRNALTAYAMLAGAGRPLDLAAARSALADVRVPGRMQRVDLGPDAPIPVVDFAHTPQAVTAAMEALAHDRPETDRPVRLIAVLGCGGDRDPDKRAPMGAAAAAVADVVVITDDNPRSEDPAAIRTATLAGAEAERDRTGRNVEVLDGGDRRAAIRTALALAGRGDLVAVLGKGHEQGQEVGDRTDPFDDVTVITEEWRALGEQP